MENPMDLTGKRILVTGASSGIGRAIAIKLSNLGASLILTGRNIDELNETIKHMKQPTAECYPMDLRDLCQIEAQFLKYVKNGKLNGMVHSAGVCPIIPLQNIKIENMLEVMNVNYFSFIEMTRTFVKRKYSEGGSIIAISSVSSQAGWPGAALYCGSKGALDASVRALAIELHKKGYRVNCVSPANIQTPMFVKSTSDIEPERFQAILEKQPLGIGNVNDVANAAAFLLSDASQFITGTAMVVDGGYLAQ